jgi:hypothetical protein
MGWRIGVAALVVGLGVLVIGQEPAGPPVDKEKKAKLFDFGGPGGKMVSNTLLEVLRDKKAQEEIGLVPPQIEELALLSQQVAFEIEPLLREFQALSKEEQQAQFETFRTELARRLAGLERDLDRVLLPEQRQRLRQVWLQTRMKKAGTAEALTSPDVLKELGLTPEHATKIRERITQIESDYRKKMLDLAADMERDILALFTPAQQQKLKELIGPRMQDAPLLPGGPKGPPKAAP